MKKIVLGTSLLVMSVGMGQGQEKPWKLKSEASFINTTGNTRTESLGLKNKYTYDWSTLGLEADANARSQREESGTTAENYFLGEKFQWKYRKPNYLFQLGTWEKDRFANLDSRTTLGGGYGRKFTLDSRQRITAEAGLQHSWEDRKNGGYEKFGSFRGFGDYRYKMNSKVEFHQTAEYIKDFENSDSFRFNTLTGLKSVLSTYLSSLITYEIRHDNDPIPGSKKTDTITTLALVAEF